ncbi:hypothetical protein Tsubulata_005445 [Turnera subulata]|uniref:Uncharacterized protein n=1 Tax=Turnera subulata TaxID=218843 RepID=A0A9Q0GEM5_9ROSI|nr:hypothetical protein Tsubulata_005445 [Turnera subulata]
MVYCLRFKRLGHKNISKLFVRVPKTNGRLREDELVCICDDCSCGPLIALAEEKWQADIYVEHSVEDHPCFGEQNPRAVSRRLKLGVYAQADYIDEGYESDDELWEGDGGGEINEVDLNALRLDGESGQGDSASINKAVNGEGDSENLGFVDVLSESEGGHSGEEEDGETGSVDEEEDGQTASVDEEEEHEDIEGRINVDADLEDYEGAGLDEFEDLNAIEVEDYEDAGREDVANLNPTDVEDYEDAGTEEVRS